MAGMKELRTQIHSIKSTQKITSAMEMVAASKMRKAQERMHMARPYADRIQKVIGHLAKATSEYQHPFMQTRPVKREGLIVVTSDRGLCGGLNLNLFKMVLHHLRNAKQHQIDNELCIIGSKGEAFFKRYGGHVTASLHKVGDQPVLPDLIGVVKVMLDAYTSQKIDKLYICYNKFGSTMAQIPTIQQLLPLVPTEDALANHWDYIYEPDPRALLDSILSRYIEMQVYHAVVENIASFQAAQMVAMKNATENAGELIDDLQLVYNKARQASITQELSEIIAGAAAV